MAKAVTFPMIDGSTRDFPRVGLFYRAGGTTMPLWVQDPQEKRKYRVPITGDSNSATTWSVSPAGPTLDSQSDTASESVIRISGLTLGTVYTLKYHMTGTSGQEYEAEGTIVCRSK